MRWKCTLITLDKKIKLILSDGRVMISPQTGSLKFIRTGDEGTINTDDKGRLTFLADCTIIETQNKEITNEPSP